MSNIIKNKVANLIQVSLKDNSIFSGSNSYVIDISDCVSKDEIENFFESNESLLYINKNIDENKVLIDLNSSNSYEECLNILNENRINLPKSNLKKIDDDFSKAKYALIENVVKYMNAFEKRFNIANFKAKELKNDKGSWNLYVTRYFIVGRTKNKKSYIKAPLFFISVNFEKSKELMYFSKNDDSFIINEKLLIYLLSDSNLDSKNIHEFKNISTIKEFLVKFKEIFGYELKNIEERNILSKKSSEISEMFDDLFLMDGITYGVYEPTGGKLKEDLEILSNKNLTKDIFDKNKFISNESIINDELYSDLIIQISSLDIYQKYAVRSALVQNTIINGPPGTGKSEVISNIITNILVNGNTSMMVSEKRAALDVLKSRLKSLSIFALEIHDIDKEGFYNSIIELDKYIGMDWQANNRNINVISLKNNDIYLKNKEIHKEFILKINDYNELKSFKVNNISYIEFLEQVVNIWNDLNTFFDIANNNVILKIDNYINELNISDNLFFSRLNIFLNYLYENGLNEKNKFDFFKKEILTFLKYIENINFDLSQIEKFSNNLKESNSIQFLNNYFNDNIHLSQIAKDNPYIFDNLNNSVNECIKKTSGLIHNNFFDDLDETLKKINSFFNIINSCKEKDVKFFFDNFVYKNNLISSKKWTESFYKTKLSNSDLEILELLKNIQNNRIDNLKDFKYINMNYSYFNTLTILYFFNKNIFSDNYINCIKNEFYKFDFEIYEIFKKYNMDINKYHETKKLINIFNEFINKFPFLKYSFSFNSEIKDFKKINWNNFDLFLKDYIKEIILMKLSSLSKEDKDFVREAINVSKVSKKKGIYKYIEKYSSALKMLFPIWISRPEQISMYTQLESGIFDYGIFDEASQMFLERAYPLLFRNKINIIAGDQNQLRPSNFFTSRFENDGEQELEINDLDVEESLLDRSKASSWNNVILKNHYRSDKKELIAFSNEFIYNNELNFASLNNNENNISGVEVINVDGFFKDKYNFEEANKTIELLNKYCDVYESILVVTANSSQALYLQNLIFSKEGKESNISQKYINEKLKIISIENVQGDEADFVIFSLCYGRKDEDSKVYSRFGPLISKGGRNRLNVAITRAKKKMIIIKSIYANDISSSDKNEELKIFKYFLSYCDTINEKIIDKKEELKEKMKKEFFDSGFEEEVYSKLIFVVEKLNLFLQTQYEVGSKKIDIVILDKNNRVLLGIEVDGWKYHSKPEKVLEDIYRQHFLESRGYVIYRISEVEWKLNKEIVLGEINTILLQELNIENYY